MRESYGRRILLDEDLRREQLKRKISEMRRVTMEINYLSAMGPDIWNDTNKWIRDTWHVPRLGKSIWFPANKTMTCGISSLVERSEGHISLDDPWPRGQLMILEKNPTPYSSMMVVLINDVCPWKSRWGNLVLSETGRTRIRNDLVLIIISYWANCTVNITVST